MQVGSHSRPAVVKAADVKVSQRGSLIRSSEGQIERDLDGMISSGDRDKETDRRRKKNNGFDR